jgi:hypothetical protein
MVDFIGVPSKDGGQGAQLARCPLHITAECSFNLRLHFHAALTLVKIALTGGSPLEAAGTRVLRLKFYRCVVTVIERSVCNSL